MAAEAREHEAQVVQKLRGRAEGGVDAGDAGPLAQGEAAGTCSTSSTVARPAWEMRRRGRWKRASR